MGIPVEFNPDLALRNIKEHKEGRRTLEECIPESLEAGQNYHFLKKGQRNYWFFGEIPLLQTEGDQRLSRPLASIVILEVTHFRDKRRIYTRGIYRVEKVLNPNSPEIYFEAMGLNPNYGERG